jgi:hypothetical protein
LAAGERNWEIRYPCAPCNWTPSKPAPTTMRAVSAKRAIRSTISSLVRASGAAAPG